MQVSEIGKVMCLLMGNGKQTKSFVLSQFVYKNPINLKENNIHACIACMWHVRTLKIAFIAFVLQGMRHGCVFREEDGSVLFYSEATPASACVVLGLPTTQICLSIGA